MGMSFGNITSTAVPLLIGMQRDRWAEYVAQLVEGRSQRVVYLVAGIWLFNAFDLALTLIAHQQGLLDEENPFARELLRHGAWPLVLYKTGLVLVGSYPLLKFRAARITELGTLVVLIAYAMLAVRWSSCYEVYHATFAQAVSQPETPTTGHGARRSVSHAGSRRYGTERAPLSRRALTKPRTHRAWPPELEDAVPPSSPHRRSLMSERLHHSALPSLSAPTK